MARRPTRMGIVIMKKYAISRPTTTEPTTSDERTGMPSLNAEKKLAASNGNWTAVKITAKRDATGDRFATDTPRRWNAVSRYISGAVRNPAPIANGAAMGLSLNMQTTLAPRSHPKHPKKIASFVFLSIKSTFIDSVRFVQIRRSISSNATELMGDPRRARMNGACTESAALGGYYRAG
mgnify:CR=1 FL=1